MNIHKKTTRQLLQIKMNRRVDFRNIRVDMTDKCVATYADR
jgi:hypothetical protein